VRKVLAIDGGGVRGVLPASFLATVEEQISGHVVDYFDLIVGTSTGGIIALGLGAGLSAAEIRNFYLERGPRIFRGNRVLRKVRHWATAKYDPQQLRTELEEVFGDKKLGESKTRLVIPSMDVNSGKVRLWKTAHHVNFVQDYPQRMVEAAMATASAPTFFQAHLTEAGTPLIDGGVFANNPAALAAVEAIGVLNWPRDEVAILSLGCGAEALDVRTRGWWRSGLVGLAPKLSAVFMAAQSDASCGMATHLIGDRTKFVRISPELPGGRYGLDVIGELRSLSARGDTEARHRLQDIRSLFFAARAATFVPELKLA
jgi:patatin-like phospholipase/acyl hydrolase